MKTTIRFVLVINLVIAHSSIAQWVTNGPYGCTVKSILVSGTNLFAGTNDGVCISTNNGASWAQAGVTGYLVYSLAPIGTNLVAGASTGIFLSTNNGTSWNKVSIGPKTGYLFSLAVSGTNIFVGCDSGVMLSTDNGSSWSQRNSGMPSARANSLVVIGTNIYAGMTFGVTGVYGGGVFLSTNNGTSWSAVNSGLLNKNVEAFAVIGTNLYAGTAGGVYLSVDSGANWTPVNYGLGNLKSVRALSASGSNLYVGTDGGVFVSTNGGAIWSSANSGLPTTYAYAFAVNGTYLFVGTNGNGIYRSASNGNNWTLASLGLTGNDVHSIAAVGGNLFAGTNADVFLSTSSGTNWISVNPGLVHYNVTAVAVIGTNIFKGIWGSGVFRSTDNGSSWTAVNSGLTSLVVTDLAVCTAKLFAQTDDGVFLSTNNGTNWTAANTPFSSFSEILQSGSYLFAGVPGSGVFLSSDGGVSWTSVNSGLVSWVVNALAVSGTNLYAGTGSGVCLSTNNGTSWNLVINGLTNTNVQSLGVSGNYLFAGTNGGGVYLSTNNGTSWSEVNSGLLNTNVKALYANSTNVFAGTSGGVFRRPLRELGGTGPRNVPSSYPTIQSALNASQSGDTVLVEPGRYRENVIWPNANGIRLIGSGDAGNTIIDGSSAGSVLSISSNGQIDSNTIIENITITGGGGVSNGAGIFCKKSSPMLDNVVVSNNRAALSGGGIYLDSMAKPKLTNVGILSNRADGARGNPNGGGGIAIANLSNPKLTNVSIKDNSSGQGGGLFLMAADVELINSDLTNNSSDRGGGMYLNNASAKFENVSFTGNHSSEDGGGAWLQNITVRGWSGARFAGNTADGNGGGMWISASASNTFYTTSYHQNTALHGGGICFSGGSPQMVIRNLFEKNSAQDEGDAIYTDRSFPSISSSSFQCNGVGVFNSDHSQIVDAAGNWWGAASGPYHEYQNPNGKGDTIYTYILVAPWLTTPDTSAPPVSVQALKVKTARTNSISLSWDPSPLGDLSGYKIYYDTDSSGFPYANTIDIGTTTSYTLTGLQAGKKYFIAITCCDRSRNESWYSNEVAAVTVNPLLSATSYLSFTNTVLGDSSAVILPIISASSSALSIDSVSNKLSIIQHNISTPTYINGNDTLKAKLVFKPVSFGIFADTLVLMTTGGTAKIRLIAASPFPVAVLSRTTINFNNVATKASKSDSVVIGNTGINILSIDSIWTRTPAFTVNKNKGVVSGGDSLKILVTFLPDQTGSYLDTLYLRNNSQLSVVKIPLSGNSPAPVLTLAKTRLDYIATAVKDSSSLLLMVKNTSISELIISSIATATAAFIVKQPFPTAVKGLDSANIAVVFRPTAFGSYVDTLTVQSNGGTAKVVLSGSSPYPAIGFIGSFDCGSQKKGQTVTKQLKVANMSINQLVIDSVIVKSQVFAFSGLSFPATIKSTDSLTVLLKFTPDSVRSYSDTMSVFSNANISPLRITLTGIGTSATGVVRESDMIPIVFSLAQNYPNPFNPSTTIKFGLPQTAVTSLRIYDVVGREIAELVNEELTAGYYRYLFFANGLASGVYFYRIEAGNFVQTRKLLLLR